MIDATGVIRHKFVGPLTEQDLQRTLLPLLEQLLAEAGS